VPLQAVALFNTMGGEFIPTLDESFGIQCKTGTTLTKTIATTTKIEQIILKIFQKLIKL
jgi:cobalt-zinc-cadmium resistance protein CzcA